MFSVIYNEIRWVSAWAVGLFFGNQLLSWWFPDNVKRAPELQWMLGWAVVVVYRVFQKLAKWERQQQGLPDSDVFEVPPFDTSVPLDVRLRELLAQNKRIEAIRQIRGYKNMSLDEASAYLKQFEEAKT